VFCLKFLLNFQSLENLNSDVVEPTHSTWLEMGTNGRLPPEEEDGHGNEAIKEEQEEEGKNQGGNKLTFHGFRVSFPVFGSLTSWWHVVTYPVYKPTT
jgi:hypothetical protein